MGMPKSGSLTKPCRSSVVAAPQPDIASCIHHCGLIGSTATTLNGWSCGGPTFDHAGEAPSELILEDVARLAGSRIVMLDTAA
jgi:hypothetical protein